MLVYRFENEKGGGPYKHPTPILDKGSSAYHPGPHEWGEPWCDCHEVPTHVFGFSDTNQIRLWFSKKERAVMYHYGYHLSVYDATEILEGRSQVSFHKKSAMLMRRISTPEEMETLIFTL